MVAYIGDAAPLIGIATDPNVPSVSSYIITILAKSSAACESVTLPDSDDAPE